MQQSNAYIIIFTGILTVILATLLSGTSVLLKDKQDQQVKLDTQKKILGAVMDISDIIDDAEAVEKLYTERISSIVVDHQGNEIKEDAKGPLIAEKVNIQKFYKSDPTERQYPVFIFKGDDGQIASYIFPMFGAGLWDWISGYIALEKDLNTIVGVAFDHKQETPGLGARITDQVVRDRFKQKKIFDGSELMSVTMVKGEGNAGLTEYEVDGLSGATMTAKGVNKMLEHYLGCYTPFIEKIKTGQKLANN